MSVKLQSVFPPSPEITDTNAGVIFTLTPGHYSGLDPIPRGLRVHARFTPAAADIVLKHDPHMPPKEQLVAGTPYFSVYPLEGENGALTVLDLRRQFATRGTVISDACATDVLTYVGQFLQRQEAARPPSAAELYCRSSKKPAPENTRGMQ
jgi:hypothetical protein